MLQAGATAVTLLRPLHSLRPKKNTRRFVGIKSNGDDSLNWLIGAMTALHPGSITYSYSGAHVNVDVFSSKIVKPDEEHVRLSLWFDEDKDEQGRFKRRMWTNASINTISGQWTHGPHGTMSEIVVPVGTVNKCSKQTSTWLDLFPRSQLKEEDVELAARFDWLESKCRTYVDYWTPVLDEDKEKVDKGFIRVVQGGLAKEARQRFPNVGFVQRGNKKL